jgi:Ala-tRNA(Pro) deacylase
MRPYELCRGNTLIHKPTSCAARSPVASGFGPERLAKGVVLSHRGGYLLAIVPASRQLSLDELARKLWQPVSLALEEEIAPLFPDCEPGAVPPVGSAYGLCAVIDDSLEDQPEIYFEAGDHQTLVHLRHDDFHRLMRTVPHTRISSDGESGSSELHYFGA